LLPGLRELHARHLFQAPRVPGTKLPQRRPSIRGTECVHPARSPHQSLRHLRWLALVRVSRSE